MATNLQRIHYSRTVAPTIEPLSLDEALRHLQIGNIGDNDYIQGLIKVAREVTENATGRALMSSTWLAVCEDWPSNFRQELIVAPVNAISHVKYYADGSDTLTTVSASNYTFSSAVSPATLTFDDDFAFPSLANRPDAVQITFTAGATTTAAVPPTLKHALRILVRHYWDNPEAVANGKTEDLPFGLRHLLESNRVSGWVV